MPHVPHMHSPSSREGEDRSSNSHEGDACDEPGVSQSFPPLARVHIQLFQVGPVGQKQRSDDRACDDYVDDLLLEVENVVHRHGTFLGKCREVFDVAAPMLMFIAGLAMGFAVGYRAAELIALSSVTQ